MVFLSNLACPYIRIDFYLNPQKDTKSIAKEQVSRGRRGRGEEEVGEWSKEKSERREA